jgi:hypothetical protein
MTNMKHTNPYREGSAYSKVFDALRSTGNKGVSRKELLKKHSTADITVILSPRKESKRGDVRGNYSAQGHLYYVIPMNGKDGQKRFRLAWRTKALVARTRKPQGSVASEKSRKVSKGRKAPVKATAEVTAEVTV